MGQRNFAFDSVAGDRIYGSLDLARAIQRFDMDGYVLEDSPSKELKVTENSPVGMSVLVGLGSAFVQGRFFEVHTSDEPLTIAASDPTNPRIDRIVVRMSTVARSVVLAVLTGTPAASPSAPLLTRTSTVWELSLAQVRVNATVTTIVNANITDERQLRDTCGVSYHKSNGYFYTGNITVSGWYRIAKNGNNPGPGQTDGDRASAQFTVYDRESGLHSSTTFIASVHFGLRPTITLLNRSYFSGNGAVQKIRLLEGGTNEGAALEVFIQIGAGTTEVEFFMDDNLHRNGWTPVKFEAGAVPAGFTTTQLDLDTHDPIMAMAADAGSNQYLLKPSGRVLDSDVPTVRAFNNVNQSIATGVATTVAFNSERWDTDVIHDNVTNNSRLTAKTAGVYAIEFSGEWDANATGQRQFFFILNGVTVIAANRLDASAAGTTQMTLSAQYRLNVNDFVEVRALQNSGVSLNILVNAQFSPEFTMTRIGGL